jgi:hypothetical protein
MSQMSRFLNKPKSVGFEVVEVSECWIYDQIGNEGFGVTIFPEDMESVRSLEVPAGHFPSRVESGFEVSTADGFAAARVENCFRDQEVFSDGSRGSVSGWKIGNGE